MSVPQKHKGGFLMLPHKLLNRALKAGLTGTEWGCFMLICQWTLGFRRLECRAGLSALHNYTHKSKQGISKALLSLQEKGLITKTKQSDRRHPSHYKILEELPSTENKNEQEAIHNSGNVPRTFPKPIGKVSGTYPKPFSPFEANGVDRGVNHNLPGVNHSGHWRVSHSGHDKEISNKENRTKERTSKNPLKVPERDIPRSSLQKLRDFPQNPLDLNVLSMSKKFSFPQPPSRPNHAFSEKSLNSLIEIYEELRGGHKVILTISEKREVERIWNQHDSFPKFFFDLVLETKKTSQPNDLREADVFMALVRKMNGPRS